MVSAFVSSPSPPQAIKAELVGLLGNKGRPYWQTLSDFLKAKISRSEFEEFVTEWINTPKLVNLHNSLITSLIYAASASLGPESMDHVNGGPKPRSRRKLLAHEKDVEVPRLRRWAVDVGRQERDRIRSTIGAAARGGGRGKRGDVAATPGLRSEIRSERGVRLMKERGNPPGTHLAIPLCESTRLLPTQQNLFDRMSLIASQHDMTSSKTAVALLMTSLDAHLKHLSGRALDLSKPNSSKGGLFNSQRVDTVGNTVTGAAAEAVLTLAPFEVPGSSASTLQLGDHGFTKPPEPSDNDKDEDDIMTSPKSTNTIATFGMRRPEPGGNGTGSSEVWRKMMGDNGLGASSSGNPGSSDTMKTRALVTGTA
ncbi:transcriptional regulator of RNA polII, SAGA, subunit [Ceratobasidium sp. AG-Ba]|nr:transcriptional regulator of RNA polII, SAGA, subunit [Ceratobasidium sp. AG-Ba]